MKPFALEEPLARVQALCRRAYGSKQPRLAIADLEIDTLAVSTSGWASRWRAASPRP